MAQPTGDFRREGIRTRSGEVLVGRLLLTIGTPDGSQAQPCPDERLPHPRRAAQPAQLRTRSLQPVLDRQADVAQLLGLLGEGQSVRLVGQAGSGRSTLLAAVAEAAGQVAPDGVVRLGGRRRTAADLLQDLFAATHHAPDFRPDRRQLAALLADVRAVVAIDDVEPSGAELEELLATAPGCAFLLAVAPGVPALPADSRLRDHQVTGLSRAACLELTARRAGRALDEIERAWAVDLWFESEGLPVRFVQAAALLRRRDVAVDALIAAQEDRTNLFGTVGEAPQLDDPALLERELRREVPLPSVAETAAPAVRLADGLSDSARTVLRLALAFGGVIPTAPHMPALIEVDQGESALTELVEYGLAIPSGGHHRLATGVQEMLVGHLETGEIADGAAQHFSWWVGHSSVSTEQIAAEAEVLIGALHADRAAGRWTAVLQLARAAAPALALALRWGAWERVLRLGLEAAREAGAGSDEAWFHHELGVLALCLGIAERADAELEAGVALRTRLGELRGNAAARRMLELLRTGPDLSGAPEPAAPGRRPVIRTIAENTWRIAPVQLSARGRRLAVIGGVVLGLGVLGTAVAMTSGGSAGPQPAQIQPEPQENGSLPTNLFANSPSADSTTAAPSPAGSSESPADSASPGATGTAARRSSAPVNGGPQPESSPPAGDGPGVPSQPEVPPSSPPTRPHPSSSAPVTPTPSPTTSTASPTGTASPSGSASPSTTASTH